MSELQTVAVIVARPGSEAVVQAALVALTGPTRDETGCLSYELFESASTPGTFVTVERWSSQDDLEAHLRSAHVAAALATTGEHLASPPGIHPLVPLTD